MNLTVSPHARDIGAAITGVDLSKPLEAEVTDEIRALWLRHQVIYFPDQPLGHPQLAAFTRAFGTFGIEPYVQVMDDHDHIIEAAIRDTVSRGVYRRASSSSTTGRDLPAGSIAWPDPRVCRILDRAFQAYLL